MATTVMHPDATGGGAHLDVNVVARVLPVVLLQCLAVLYQLWCTQ